MSVHSFHIPVMGTGFTIDTPLKVARYGISSVMSVDDNLMEKLREYYSAQEGLPFQPIAKNLLDSRARRITAYLNLVHDLVQKQFSELKQSSFEPGSEITKYFELLADDSELKKEYSRMMAMEAGDAKIQLQSELRQKLEVGSIDVNLLTKLDRENYQKGEKLSRDYADGVAALRGFAQSKLESSVVFSAGINPYLYGSLEQYSDFFPDPLGAVKKKIIIKVSDFRSAVVQGRFLAKKGLWVSEFRVESGLNCGGHAFATTGQLLGVILEEFKKERESFSAELFEIYKKALLAKGKMCPSVKPRLRVTAQGGVGTFAEHQFLLRHYQLDSVGWGSPFLLVPEVTCVDPDSLTKLSQADENTVYLSDLSPLGVPIYSLRNSASEAMRLQRIAAGKPGSPCLNKYMAYNTEFPGEPLCAASSEYQSKKIAQLKTQDLSPEKYSEEYKKIVDKACVCHDLGEGALLKYGIPSRSVKPVPAVCPGPNIVYFFKIATLREMVDHIYGRMNLLKKEKNRPHMLINEFRIYIDFFKKKRAQFSEPLNDKDKNYLSDFLTNLNGCLNYYFQMIDQLFEESLAARDSFLESLKAFQQDVDSLTASLIGLRFGTS